MRNKTEKLLEIKNIVQSEGKCIITSVHSLLPPMPEDEDELREYWNKYFPSELWDRPEWYEMTEQEIMFKLEEQRRFAIQIGSLIDPISRDEFNSLFTQCGYDPPNVTDEMLENLSIHGYERTVSNKEAKALIYEINKLRRWIECKVNLKPRN
jgi:hypothetical protein